MTFAVFTALALGLAAPYVLLSWQPAWVRVLPKPGAWMEVLKQFTAVPLFATAIWLAWVYGQLFGAGEGVNQVALLLGCFLVLAIAGWALGRWPAKWASRIAAVVLIALGLAIPLSQARGSAAGGDGDGECCAAERICDEQHGGGVAAVFGAGGECGAGGGASGVHRLYGGVVPELPGE